MDDVVLLVGEIHTCITVKVLCTYIICVYCMKHTCLYVYIYMYKHMYSVHSLYHGCPDIVLTRDNTTGP